MENNKITWDTHWTDLKAIAVGGLVFKVEIAIYLFEVKSFEIGNYSKYFQMKTKMDNGDWWRTIKSQDLRLGIQPKPLICRKITPIPTLDMTTIGFTRQKGRKITSFVNFKNPSIMKFINYVKIRMRSFSIFSTFSSLSTGSEMSWLRDAFGRFSWVDVFSFTYF